MRIQQHPKSIVFLVVRCGSVEQDLVIVLMRTLTNIPHKFDLKGFRVDDAFLGCKNCWWRAERGEVMKPICPECGEQLYVYYVRKEDL